MHSIKLIGDWAPGTRRVNPLPWPGLVLGNLEGPLVADLGKHAPVAKAGPHLAHYALPTGPEMCVLSLANNHLMDYGVTGLLETLRACASRGVRVLGAGRTKDEAAQPLIVDWHGVRLGLLARCETQFGVASDRRAGVAAWDATIYRAIHELKGRCDIVLVSIHAATENSPWPSPKRQEDWRALVEAGADVVHGHHAHVPQGWELYEGAHIFYGLGNCCVDPVTWTHHQNALWSLAPELSWQPSGIDMQAVTVVVDEQQGGLCVRDATPSEAQEHRSYLEYCNRPLGNRDMLEALWQEVAVRMYQEVYANWLRFESTPQISSSNFVERTRELLRQLHGRAPKPPLPVAGRQRKWLLWYHLFACESHRDAIATALGVLGGTLDDRRSEESARLVDWLMPDLPRGDRTNQ